MWKDQEGAQALLNLWLMNHADLMWLHMEIMQNVGMQMWYSDVQADSQTFGCQCCFPLLRAFGGLATVLSKYSCFWMSADCAPGAWAWGLSIRSQFGRGSIKIIAFVTLWKNGMGYVPLKYTCKNLFLNVLGFFSLRQKLRSNLLDLLKS